MSARRKRRERDMEQWDDAGWSVGQPDADENEPLKLQEVLEPYGSDTSGYADAQGYQNARDYAGAEARYDENGQPVYGDMYEDYDDYDDEPEGDADGRFRVAMSVFNVISVLVGILAILLFVALLVSLVNWLSTDIRHSFVLLQSNLQ